jgi:quercetin dioxygenase-like cupin family protein
MREFPEFMRNPANAIDPAMQSEGVEGYVFDGADGSQMAFWTTAKSGSSSEHTHGFDEYFVVLEGKCIVYMKGERIVLRRGDECYIPKDTPHSTEFVSGTRTIHAFGGKRAERSSHSDTT